MRHNKAAFVFRSDVFPQRNVNLHSAGATGRLQAQAHTGRKNINRFEAEALL